jgi:hypothetical protein
LLSLENNQRLKGDHIKSELTLFTNQAKTFNVNNLVDATTVMLSQADTGPICGSHANISQFITMFAFSSIRTQSPLGDGSSPALWSPDPAVVLSWLDKLSPLWDWFPVEVQTSCFLHPSQTHENSSTL